MSEKNKKNEKAKDDVPDNHSDVEFSEEFAKVKEFYDSRL